MAERCAQMSMFLGRADQPLVRLRTPREAGAHFCRHADLYGHVIGSQHDFWIEQCQERAEVTVA